MKFHSFKDLILHSNIKVFQFIIKFSFYILLKLFLFALSKGSIIANFIKYIFKLKIEELPKIKIFNFGYLRNMRGKSLL